MSVRVPACTDVSRIINERHTRRLAALLNDPTLDVVVGGDVDEREKCVSQAPKGTPRVVLLTLFVVGVTGTLRRQL